MTLLDGNNLGPYRIIKQIGKGGMATIYKAFQPGMDRYVAIKVLPPKLVDDEQFVQRFQQEARAISKLEHPRILPVYDYGEHEGVTYIVLRYVDSGTLKDRMAQGRLSLAEVTRIISQVAGALEYAHQEGVIHRDVKPANVLLDKNGNVYLMDFGLARIMESSVQLSATGVSVGTPAYMSPEQGKGEKVDSRSDIYSLGIMLYEMVTGQVPYEADTPLAVLIKHIMNPLPLPSTVFPEISDSVERVILKALAKEPEHRYQTAGELANGLQTAVSSTPIQPAPTPKQPPASEEQLSFVARVQQTWQQPAGKVIMLVVAALFLIAFGFLLSRLNRVGVGITSIEPTPTDSEVVLELTTPVQTIVSTPTQQVPTSTPIMAAVEETAVSLTPIPTSIPEITTPIIADSLPRNTNLYGFVVDALTRQGIWNANVIAFPVDGSQEFSAESDGNGHYFFQHLPSGNYFVQVDAANYAMQFYGNVSLPRLATSIIIPEMGEPVEANFALTEGGSISGFVYESDGSTPLHDIHISVFTPGEHHALGNFHTSTNADGSYTIDGLPLGEYVIEANGSGWVKQAYDNKLDFEYGTLINIIPGNKVSGVDFNLNRGGTISGFVYEEDGRTPIEGAAVHASTQTTDGEWFGSSINTLEDGSYTIADLPTAQYQMYVTNAGYAPKVYGDMQEMDNGVWISVTEGQNTPNIDFTLESGVLVSGHVYDEDGQTPIPFIYIISKLPTGENIPSSAITNFDGYYEMWLAPGEYLLSTDVSGISYAYVNEWYYNQPDEDYANIVNVEESDQPQEINFHLSKASAISGFVYEADGITPVAGANVIAVSVSDNYPRGANTQSDGSYKIEGLPSGDYVVNVEHSGYRSQYYPYATNPNLAEMVRVNAPDKLSGIDFNLIKTGDASGSFDEENSSTSEKANELNEYDEIHIITFEGYSVQRINNDLFGPVEIDVNSNGNILVANAGFFWNGALIQGKDFISLISPDGETIQRAFIDGLTGSSGVAIDSQNQIYVSQAATLPIRKYDENGNFLFEFEAHRPQFTDPNTLTLTQDNRLLMPVEDVSADNQWRILAFDMQTGERAADFTPPFDFEFVHTIVFFDNKIYISGLGLDGELDQILVAEEGKQPLPYEFNHLILDDVGPITFSENGDLFAITGAGLLHISLEGEASLIAEGFENAWGLKAHKGCLLVADGEFDDIDDSLYRICPDD